MYLVREIPLEIDNQVWPSQKPTCSATRHAWVKLVRFCKNKP